MECRHARRLIKIDRIFVDGLGRGAEDRALLQAILGVARALGVKAVAEGVETAGQALLLASLGCNEVQGFHFAKPMPAAQLLAWLDVQSALAIGLPSSLHGTIFPSEIQPDPQSSQKSRQKR